MKADIGVVGMAVMGANLALNIESRGYAVAVYNRTPGRSEELMRDEQGKRLCAAWSLEELVAMLQKPRKLMLMVQAGKAVDQMIAALLPLLEPDDILIDGGNSFYGDTERRARELLPTGILYIGTGVSGGEEGALKGPSIMPGGSFEAYVQVESMLRSIAAVAEGEPCCAYMGPGGAGHFVKMVHNGIEYSDMQLIAEAYSLLSGVGGLSIEEIREVFLDWDKGELQSYLIEITGDILGVYDPETGKPMVDIILDSAEQKGTGKWTSQVSLDFGTPAPSIAEAVYARFLSAMKAERMQAEVALGRRDTRAPLPLADRARFIESVRQALYASKVCSYAQGFGILRSAAAEYGWKLDMGSIAKIWRGGCIIRARFLNRIHDAYKQRADLPNLLLDAYFAASVKKYEEGWRETVSAAVMSGTPVPGLSSALAYYDGYRSARLPANIIQAQRDYFGAHTYRRVDKEGLFHTRWEDLKPPKR